MTRKSTLILLVIISLIIGVYFVNNKNTVTRISDDSAKISDQIKAIGGQLIDVRTSEEYIASHADSAINVPLDDILDGKLSKINKNKPLYVYCRSGKRAGQAKVALEKAGYKDVVNLGGLSNWQNQGGVVCKSMKSDC
jgi:phage shock protein E